MGFACLKVSTLMLHNNFTTMRNLTIFLLLCFPVFLSAQSWELGLAAQAANYQGDLVKTSLFTLKETNFAGGVFLRRNFNESWALRLGADFGKLSGDDQNFEKSIGRNFSFTNSFADFNLLLEWSPLGKTKSDGKMRRIRPYLLAGPGYFLGNPKPIFGSTFNAAGAALDKIEVENQKNGVIFVIGGGFKFHLTERVTLELESTLRPSQYDYLDGISEAAEPNHRDWYVLGGLNLVFNLGKAKDSDGDGISDKLDKCPTTPGVVENMGCPADRDKDGVADAADKCPDVVGIAANNGCPADRDGDGVYDTEDKCPDVVGVAANMGCPADRDKDGIADADDKCPDLAGITANKGCPADRDGDGVYDSEDKCPDVKGIAANMGCPSDRDKDGIADTDDKCPDLVGLASNKGCPADRDGDGVYDKDDKCPDVVGLLSNAGCPAMKAEDKKVLDLAVQNINFEPNKAVLTKDSYKVLDQVADILTRYNYYSAAIDGHTDSQGDDEANLKLSKNRAQTCFDYLVKKGVPAARLTHEGYGETKPVAENKTAEGRRKNRRVEFNLSVK
jgi:OOP family OmpA-OmpF porin